MMQAPDVPEVLPQPGPDVRVQPNASIEAFGGGAGLDRVKQATQGVIGDLEGLRAERGQVGQEYEQIAQTSGKIAAFEKIRADQTAVQEAVDKLSQAHNQLLYDPKSGVLASRGTNAIAAHDDALKKFHDAANDISGSLHGQNQVGAFNRHAFEMDASFNRTAMAHVAQQQDELDNSSFKALIRHETNRGALAYSDPQTRDGILSKLDAAAEAYAMRHGMDPEQKDLLKSDINSNYHEETLSQMVNDPNFQGQAKAYFSDHKEEMQPESRDRVLKLFDVIPRQQQEIAKKAQEDFYKSNMRQSMLDMFDGKLTLSEAQRRFRDNELDKSDYNLLEGKLSKPDAAVIRSLEVSDPSTFNEIRQAQLTGSKSPGEIQRMIAKGAASKDITPDDGKYLLNVNSEKPPTPRDKYIESQANNIRDFGSRYFAETNFFGMATNKDKTSKEAESLVSDFYSAVDKSKAQGEDVDKIRDQIKKTAMQKRFPGLGNLEAAPDIVVDVKGKVTHLLNPDQHSALKPRFNITRLGSNQKQQE